MTAKVDLRVIKTKKAIRTAFIHLLRSKGLDTMTVQDILNEALINRKTFYTYYHDKYDLAEQIAREFLEQLDTIIHQRFPDETTTHPVSLFIDEMYSELYQNKKELLAIWSIRTNRIDVSKEISVRLQNIYQQLAAAYQTPGDIALQSYMFSTFVMTSYQYIMQKEQTYETHQLLIEYQHLYDVIERATDDNKAHSHMTAGQKK